MQGSTDYLNISAEVSITVLERVFLLHFVINRSKEIVSFRYLHFDSLTFQLPADLPMIAAYSTPHTSGLTISETWPLNRIFFSFSIELTRLGIHVFLLGVIVVYFIHFLSSATISSKKILTCCISRSSFEVKNHLFLLLNKSKLFQPNLSCWLSYSQRVYEIRLHLARILT